VTVALGAAGPDASSWQRCSQQRACIGGSDTASRDAGRAELRELRHFAPAHTALTALRLRWRRGLASDQCRCPIRRARLVTGLVKLSLPSLPGTYIEYRPASLRLRHGAFTCVRWQVSFHWAG